MHSAGSQSEPVCHLSLLASCRDPSGKRITGLQPDGPQWVMGRHLSAIASALLPGEDTVPGVGLQRPSPTSEDAAAI